MDKGKEGGGLRSCCRSSESSFESEDKRVVRFGKEWSEYEREKGSGHEASARHLTITKWSGSGRKSRDSDSTDMLPLHLLGGQNFDRPWSSVFIGANVVFVCAVKGIKIVGIKQTSDRDGGTGASMVRNESKGCEAKTRDGAIK